jgi:uncharacterized protein (DUF305 family)
MFAQMMVPHHAQGVAIVKLARSRAANAELKLLAAAIETTQAAEAQTMAGWLRDWRQPPTAAPGGHDAHGGMPATSQAEFTALAKAAGADFDRRFLHTLIAHQDDAIQIASMEVGAGVNAQCKALADRIVRSRKAQIQQMLALLDGL